MKILLSVIKAIVEILAKQHEAIVALQDEVDADNTSELTEADFADLSAQLASLNLPDTMG